MIFLDTVASQRGSRIFIYWEQEWNEANSSIKRFGWR